MRFDEMRNKMCGAAVAVEERSLVSTSCSCLADGSVTTHAFLELFD
jgi:hypothetical protein